MLLLPLYDVFQVAFRDDDSLSLQALRCSFQMTIPASRVADDCSLFVGLLSIEVIMVELSDYSNYTVCMSG